MAHRFRHLRFRTSRPHGTASSPATVYVIGHKNPDTDAICSAIGNAALLRATGEPTAMAARCGEVPARTAWVLEQAGIETPPLITDVRATAGMICRRDVVQVAPCDTFLDAYRRMLASGVRCVPVVHTDGTVSGILRYLDLLELLVPGDASGVQVRTVNVALSKIATTLHAESVGAEMPPGDDEEELHPVGRCLVPVHDRAPPQIRRQGRQRRPLPRHLRRPPGGPALCHRERCPRPPCHRRQWR